MITYLIFIYLFMAVICFVGCVNEAFDGNSWQRAGLGMFALWAVWRIYLLSVSTWGYLHEPLFATAAACYAFGTVLKTRHYCKRRNRAAGYKRGKNGI